MLRIALLLLILATPMADAGPQLANTLSFRALVLRTQSQCPTSKVHRATPAGLLAVERDFRDRLPYAQREIVRNAIPRAADGTPQQCVGRDTNCHANAELDAIWKSGLLEAFADTVCARGTRPRR